MRRVVITSVGTINSIGNNVEETWQAILNKKSGIGEITQFDTDNFKVKLAAEVKTDLEQYIDGKELKRNDRFTNLGLIAADEAAIKSGIDFEKIDSSRFGVLFTSGIGGLKTTQEDSIAYHERQNSRFSPYLIPKVLINLLPGQIAIKYKAQSYVSSVVTACAASTNAIGDAFLRIKNDLEDVIIAGGSEACICELAVGGFQAMRALSQEIDPVKACVPFDKDRSGFVMGEGAAALVLEELEHAKARGANILGEIVGYGVSCDANHITSPILDGSIGAAAIAKAIKSANIKPEQVGYINAHGTSTSINDETECKAINRVFSHKPYVSSTKGNTGHLLGGAGALEAVLTTLALNEQIIMPTINTTNIDEACDANIPLDFVKKSYEYAISNSLGFGGHNAAIVIKKWNE